MYFTALLAFVLGTASNALAEIIDFGKYTCPMEGPRFPRPRNLAKSELVQAALRIATGELNQGVNQTIVGGWSNVNSSFSFALVTSESPKPIWEYHYLGTGNVNGTKHLDGDSQYLVGSLSKLITVMVLKKSGIDMSRPITDFIPELDHPDAKVQWRIITLQMLADHLSGIPANFGFSEYYEIKDKFIKWGFPNISNADYLGCGVGGLNKQCKKEDVLKGMRTIEPVTAPNRHVVYSQLSYILLGYALSSYMGGKNYTEIVQEVLSAPLGLKNTGTPDNQVTSRGVIPPVTNWWDADFGETVPGGGLHTSTNDVAAIMQSLLSYKFMSASSLFAWMKPTALTSSLYTLVGTPWEMFRYDNLTPAYPQIIDVYGKGGSAYGYNCKISFFEQYGKLSTISKITYLATVFSTNWCLTLDLGFVGLTAGEVWPILLIPDMIWGQLIPAVEEETRRQTLDNYAYAYSNFDYNSTINRNGTDNVVFGVTVDTGPGMVITNLTRGGIDILSNFGDIFRETFGKLGDIPVTIFPIVRLFPMDYNTYAIEANGRNVTKEEWRIKWDPVYDASQSTWQGTNLTSLNTSGDACGSWVATDWIHYGGVSIEKIVFVRDSLSGDVLRAELPWLRANLTVDHSNPIRPWWSNNITTANTTSNNGTSTRFTKQPIKKSKRADLSKHMHYWGSEK